MSTGQNCSSVSEAFVRIPPDSPNTFRRRKVIWVICKRKPWWGSPFYTGRCFPLVRHLLFGSPFHFSKLVSRHQDMSSYLRRTRMHHMRHTLRTQSPLRALKSQAWRRFLQRCIKWFSEIQNDPKRRDEWELKKRSEQIRDHFHPLIVDHRWICQFVPALGIRARATGCGASCGIQVPRYDMDGYFKLRSQHTCDILWWAMLSNERGFQWCKVAPRRRSRTNSRRRSTIAEDWFDVVRCNIFKQG